MIESALQFGRSKNKTGISFYNTEDEEQIPKKVSVEEEDDFESDIDRRMNASLKETDKKISLFLFYISLSLLLSIFCYQYGTALYLLAVSRLQDWSWFLVPLVCGVSAWFFSWMIIYKDSRIPGVDPPFPFATSKQTLAYEPQPRFSSFQINYLFTFIVGLFVFVQMLYFRLHPLGTPA